MNTLAQAAPAGIAEAAAAQCFHCGQALPRGPRFSAVVGGAARAMCCAGCAAVAQAIADNGLQDYYARRDAFAGPARDALPTPSELRAFDRPEIQAAFVAEPAEHEREAALILEGLNCPACIWLNEAHLARQPGVLAVRINYTTRRALVRWDERRTRLSDILTAVQAIGYRAFPYDPGIMEASRQRERRDALRRLAVAGLGMMQVMMYAFPAYVAGAGEITPDLAALMRWASLVLTFPVVAYAAAPFFRGAARDLRRRRAGMDVPVALGIAAAFGASAAATFSGRGEVYFDSVAMFVFFLLAARYLELRARQRAAADLEALSRSMPALAHRFVDFARSDGTETVAAGELRAGDRVLVRPGECFPADGRIERGETAADESLLTGESAAVGKRAGDAVIGGSVNRGNAVAVTVERVGGQTLLSGIVRLMERAARQRPRIEAVTDRIATRFVLSVLAAAAAAGLFWAVHDPARALPVAVAVLVVTCPCALSLATPMAMAVASAAMARLGIVVTSGQAIETLAKATHFVFDKTGTLTEGHLEVVEVRTTGGIDRARALALAAALERQSEHALGRAIVAAATVPAQPAVHVENRPGEGVQGLVEGRRLRLGSGCFTGIAGGDDANGPRQTSVWLADEQGPLAQFLLEDHVREDAADAVAALQQQGAHVMLLSGDALLPVHEVARRCGIAHERSRMLPAQKLEAVRELQRDGAIVAMIGDGVNDAPVLAQAQVSVAMGGGAALAQVAADMVLVSPRLADVARGAALARRTLRIVRQNLAWAFAYNVVALPLAIGGWLTPWMAGIGMSASSAFVVLNALRARGD